MFKLFIFAAILAFAAAVPAPVPAPAPAPAPLPAPAPKPAPGYVAQPLVYSAYPAYSAYNNYYGIAPLPYQPLITSYSGLPIVKPVAYAL